MLAQIMSKLGQVQLELIINHKALCTKAQIEHVRSNTGELLRDSSDHEIAHAMTNATAPLNASILFAQVKKELAEYLATNTGTDDAVRSVVATVEAIEAVIANT